MIKANLFFFKLQNYSSITRKLYDSGCSFNMFISPLEFGSSISGISEPIELADGPTIYSKGYGTSTIYGRATHVPGLSQSLISTVQDDIAGNFTLFFVLDKESLCPRQKTYYYRQYNKIRNIRK